MIFPYTTTFKCQGKAGIGCKDEPTEYPPWFTPPQVGDPAHFFVEYDVPTMQDIDCVNSDLKNIYNAQNGADTWDWL